MKPRPPPVDEAPPLDEATPDEGARLPHWWNDVHNNGSVVVARRPRSRDYWPAVPLDDPGVE